MKRLVGPKALLPAILVLSAGLVAGIVIAAATTAPSEKLSAATAQYDQHNYKQALKLCDAILAAKPDGDELIAAKRLRALSMCKLPDQNGFQYAKQIMADNESLKTDADLWLAMGEERQRNWPRKDAYESFKTAAELYEKADQLTQAADAYFKAAEMLNDTNVLPQPTQQGKPSTQPWEWQERQQYHIGEAVKIYEHIASLKVDDERKARALLQAGERTLQLGDWPSAQKAIALLERCVKECPRTPQAPAAQYSIGAAMEQFERFIEAIAAYQKVFENYPSAEQAKPAKDRIADIKAPRIAMGVEKGYLPGEEVRIYWNARNIKKLHLKAKAVDLVALVGKAGGSPYHNVLPALREAQGEVVKEWTFDTPDDGTHKFYFNAPVGEGDDKQTTKPIPLPVKENGAYWVTASGVNADGKSESASCLVVISSLAAIAKNDQDQTLIFVADARTGASIGDADVAASRYGADKNGHSRTEHASGKTNDAGVTDLKLAKQTSCQWIAAVKKGDDQAICTIGNYGWYWWGYGEAYKVYGFTERPVYRPGQTVSFKQIIRRSEQGTYTLLAGKSVRVTITNPKGETIYAKDLVTDEFGAVEGSLPIKDDAPLGVYNISLRIDNTDARRWDATGNRFRVEEYKKPEFKVTVEPAKPDYRVGDEMQINIGARYYFGQPVAGAEVKFTIRKQSYTHHYDWPRPWDWYYDDVFYGGGYGRGRYGRPYRPWDHPQFDELLTTGTVKTDANGEALVTVKADPIKEHEELDLKFVVETEVTDSSRRVIRGSGEVKVTHTPFFIHIKPAQYVYGPGDSVELEVKAENPSGQPVAGAFELETWTIQRIRLAEKDANGNEFQEKLDQKIHTAKLTVPATGRVNVRFTPDVTGNIRVIVREVLPAGGDKARKPVEGQSGLWIASKAGAEAHYAYNDLQIVPSSDQYEVGQTMKVLVNTAKPDSRVLLTAEADDLLWFQVVHVEANSKLIEVKVGKELCPNFTLTATAIRDGKLLMDSKQIIVPPTTQFLKIALSLDKGDLGGGEGNKYQPREKTNVRVKVTDMQTGKPAVGQVTLMMVDSSLYYIQPEFREAIEKAFYGYVRRQLVATTDSYQGPASISPWHGVSYGRGGGKDGMRGGADMLAHTEAMPAPAMAPAATNGRAMAMKGDVAGDAEGGAAAIVEPVVREFFRDTVLWAGSVVTDADGTATVPVAMPDQLTTFALHAIAADKDSKVGQVQSDVITTKRVIVRLEGGRFFTEGDHAYVTVIAHNYYDTPQKLDIDLTATDAVKLQQVKLNGRWIDYASGTVLKQVEVPAGGEVRLDFKTTAERPGEVKLVARALGTKESDAIQLTKPVVPWGAVKLLAQGGVLRGPGDGTTTFEFVVPKEIKPGSQSLTVTLSPSIAAVAMESLPFLAGYPYGCVEQTMSRFLPTVVMRKTLQDAGVSLDDVRNAIDAEIAKDPKLAAKWTHFLARSNNSPIYSSDEVDRMIAAGLKRLADMQHSDGGWGWWKDGDSDPYMTAYVTMGLAAARDCDVKLPNGMLDRTAKFLLAQAVKPKLRDDETAWWARHHDNDNCRVYVVYALGLADKAALKNAKVSAELDRLFKDRDGLTDYGRALLAMVLHAAGQADQAKTVVANFDNTAVYDAKTDSASWGRSEGWWYWYDGATETTAWVLQAMLTVSPENKFIPQAVNWLVQNRREGYWWNTKTTAMVVNSLARYAKAAGELDCDQTIDVSVDGQSTQTIRVTRANLFTFDDRIALPAEALSPGKHVVAVKRTGKGTAYINAYLKYFDKSEKIAAAGNRIAVKREYFRLVPEKFENTRRVWKNGTTVDEKFPDIRFKSEPLAFGAEIASGDMIEVRLTFDVDNELEYVMFEDAKPAGCEPYQLVSGAAYGGGAYANMELRDTKVVFFANWLHKGQSSLSYRLVCEQPGTFRVLPTAGEAMYAPFVQAISDSGNLTITEKP